MRKRRLGLFFWIASALFIINFVVGIMVFNTENIGSKYFIPLLSMPVLWLSMYEEFSFISEINNLNFKICWNAHSLVRVRTENQEIFFK